MSPSTATSTRFETIVSPLVPLPAANIDTDQIVPGRFLTTTERAGIGRFLFYDWRRDTVENRHSGCPLDAPRHRDARVIVAGPNFGCGSSREHAVWALLDAGYRAVVASSFGDIFRANALRNGLLAVTVEEPDQARLLDLARRDPAACVEIGIDPPRLAYPDGETISFPLDPFVCHCLVEGIDTLTYLVRQDAAIAAYEQHRPARVDTRSSADPLSEASA